MEPGNHSEEHPEKGALLIELLLGSICILIALTAVMSVVLSSAVMRQQNAERTLAYNAASNALEELRTLPVDQLLQRDSLDFDCPALNGGTGGLHALPGDGDQLPGELSVSVESAGARANVYRVVAQVAWKGVRGPQRLSLETLIGERTVK